MVLELQVGIALALFGLLGLVLLAFEGELRVRPAPWIGFFLGVFLYLVIHDLTEAFLLEPTVRATVGHPGSFALMVLGLLLGGGAASLFLRLPAPGGDRWTPVLLLAALALALHSTLDGLGVGATLQLVPLGYVLRPDVVGLQALHRFLEGGVAVVLLLAAGVRKGRVAAITLYVGLPLVLTMPLAPLLSGFLATSVTLLLAFALGGLFFVLLPVGLWPLLSERGSNLRAAQWLLVGFLVAVVAHSLAH